MQKRNMLGILLSILTGCALLTALFVRAFFPRVILPRLDLPAMVLLCLLALLLDFYLAGVSKRNYWLIALYGALAFGLLPMAASFTAPLTACLLAVLGGVIFPGVTFLFDSMLNRLSSGPAAKLAPAVCALGLYLAAQCLMGLL